MNWNTINLDAGRRPGRRGISMPIEAVINREPIINEITARDRERKCCKFTQDL